MNIFYLHSDPTICAQYHNDNHVVKMQLETAQMLCFVHWKTGSEAPYKQNKAHMMHPCTLWAYKSLSNYVWLCELGMALLEEHKFRFNKPDDYKTKASVVIEWAIDNFPNIPDIGFTPPAQAMSFEYKNTNPVLAYRTYYNEAKQFYIKQDKKVWYTWRKRGMPHWFKSRQPVAVAA